MKALEQKAVATPETPALSVFDFLNYRDFLKAYYVYRKGTDGRFSIRMFSRLADMKGGNHIKLIMDGERNLTRNHAATVAKVCKLDRRETEYFLHLIEFNHSQDPKIRDLHWAQLKRFSPKGTVNILSQHQTQALSQWFVLPLLEMINLKGFVYSPKLISKKLFSMVTPQEVEKAFGLLLDAGLITNHHGKIEATHKTNFIGSDIPNDLIKLFHSQMIPQAIPAMFASSPSVRQFAATTVSIKEEDIPRLKQRIQEFQNEFLHEGENTEDPDCLYQFNIQFFPLMKEKFK